MMETALQGAARQAQPKADEIAKLMNENEQLKAALEDAKRKSIEAEIESLREEYHQRVSALLFIVIVICVTIGQHMFIINFTTDLIYLLWLLDQNGEKDINIYVAIQGRCMWLVGKVVHVNIKTQ